MRELERTRHPLVSATDALPPIAVIGRGRVGGSLAAAARAAGLQVSLGGRGEIDAACSQAAMALICVPDEEIAAACERVSRQAPPLRFVGHTSGSTGLDALAAAAEAGAATFSVHPLQTIPDDETDPAGAPAAIAGSTPESVAVARRLAEALGMVPFEVPEHARAAYHAAASIASNFLVALEETAAELLERAGVESGRELLAPLVLRSAANWADRGGAALTGPIARGDELTVQRHLEAIDETAPELRRMYEALAERTVEIARPREPG